MPTPTLTYDPSVKLNPRWQASQAAFLKKTFMPRTWDSVMADLSPAW
jgi:hypothetical protein